MSNIRDQLTVDCPFSAVIDYVEHFFAQRHKLPLSGLRRIKTEVTTEYNVVIDRVDTARRHDALEVSWYPKETFPLPAFHGVLSVRPHFRGSTLELQGSYEPPLGGVGKAFDAAVGRGIAQGTIGGLLRDIKKAVEDQWEQERRTFPDIETLNRHKTNDN